MQNYSEIISTKYAVSTDFFEVVWMPDPAQVQAGHFDPESGLFIPPDNSQVPLISVITYWALPAPQPTIAELDAYAASPEYLSAWGAKLKAEAVERVNDWSDAIIVSSGILIKQTFYGPMVANIAFRLLEWTGEGRPAEPNPLRYITTYSEAQAYRDAHAGQGDAEERMSAMDLLLLQESRWREMQTGFAGILYARRLVLEQIKLATVDETLPVTLEALVAGLNSLLQQHVAGLQQMEQQVLEQP